MLTREYGKVVFECDECGDILETSEIDFENALAALHSAAWQSRNVNGNWVHYCKECKNDG